MYDEYISVKYHVPESHVMHSSHGVNMITREAVVTPVGAYNHMGYPGMLYEMTVTKTTSHAASDDGVESYTIKVFVPQDEYAASMRLAEESGWAARRLEIARAKRDQDEHRALMKDFIDDFNGV